MKILLLALLVAGCSSVPNKTVVIGEPLLLPATISHPILPEPLIFRPVESMVLDRAASEYYFYNETAPLVGLRTEQYENLLYNMISIEAYIAELQSIIRHYRLAVKALQDE